MQLGLSARIFIGLIVLLVIWALALRAGGAVHLVLGNHEVMVMTGDLRYVSAAEVGQEGFHDALYRPQSRVPFYGTTAQTVPEGDPASVRPAAFTPEIAERGGPQPRVVRLFTPEADRSYSGAPRPYPERGRGHIQMMESC
ncbi:MAG TPA: hypothetical protein ENH48_13420 [Halieaceae bacterium]|nr:hypothetical protein [Halieaceae bacterium]